MIHYSPLRYPGGKNCIFPFVSKFFYENGLIGINLPYMGKEGAAPERLLDNLQRDSQKNNQNYARYYTYPSSKSELREWIEDAHKARESRASLIHNGRDMM